VLRSALSDKMSLSYKLALGRTSFTSCKLPLIKKAGCLLDKLLGLLYNIRMLERQALVCVERLSDKVSLTFN